MAKGTGKSTKPAKKHGSYRDLDPVEQGGRVARDGFDYQDHVAVGKCLDMLLGGGPVEVWCEAEDDIVQVWRIGTEEWFEFVQVKGNDLGQAWTVAKLSELEIAKKSLAHDRAAEKCRFRLVTRWKPDDILSPLAAEFGTDTRTVNATGISAAGEAIQTKIGAYTSPNGNSVDFWAANTAWEVRASAQDVRNQNLLKLERMLQVSGPILDLGQRERLYDRLYLRVQDASLACGRTEKQVKRLKRAELLTWLTGEANAILNPLAAGTSATLERKLTAAQVSAVSVEAAKEQRFLYLREVRKPKFLSLAKRDTVEAEALARLHRLKTQLDAGEFLDSGPQFLNRCQQVLLAYRDSLPDDTKPPDSFMLGYLYEVMNRCRHDLLRMNV